MTQSHIQFVLRITLICVSVFTLLMPTPTWANQISSTIQNKQSRGQVPGRGRAGASRNPQCPVPQTAMTALVPFTEVPNSIQPIVYVGGQTISEHPAFWFYVPYALSTELTADFVLKNDQGAIVYTVSSVHLPTSESSPGIINISLPQDVILEVNRVYTWLLKINCSKEILIYTEGGIERVVPDATLTNRLASASSQEQVALYQEKGLWYDAITVLGNLRREHPRDEAIAADWKQLLQSVGIVDIPTDLAH